MTVKHMEDIQEEPESTIGGKPFHPERTALAEEEEEQRKREAAEREREEQPHWLEEPPPEQG